MVLGGRVFWRSMGSVWGRRCAKELPSTFMQPVVSVCVFSGVFCGSLWHVCSSASGRELSVDTVSVPDWLAVWLLCNCVPK